MVCGARPGVWEIRNREDKKTEKKRLHHKFSWNPPAQGCALAEGPVSSKAARRASATGIGTRHRRGSAIASRDVTQGSAGLGGMLRGLACGGQHAEAQCKPARHPARER